MALPIVKNVHFGVEVETVTRFAQPCEAGSTENNADRLAWYIEKFFANLGVDMEGQDQVVVALRGKTPNDDYQTWKIQEEDTISTGAVPGLHPLEYATPILLHDEGPGWKNKFKAFFDGLKMYVVLSTNDTCSTHVHMSLPGGWHMEHLRRIAKSIIYFEPALCVITPDKPDRRNWALRNRQEHHKFMPMSTEAIFEAIDGLQTLEEVPRLMNSAPPSGYPTKYFSWNFKELMSHGLGTVEFRMGPGCTSFAECEPWVELAVAFIRAATNYGTSDYLLSLSDDVEGLKGFLGSALPEEEKLVPKRFGEIFKDKTGKYYEVRVHDNLALPSGSAVP